MRKLISLFAISTLLLAGCSSDEPTVTTEIPDISMSSKRTVEDAIAIASQYARPVENLQGRSTALSVDISSVTPIVKHTSRSNSDTLMYAVDFADNNGYVIVSANKATEPILAIIEEGNYKESLEIENPGFNQFMELAENYVSTAAVIIPQPNPDPNPNPGFDLMMTEYTDTIARRTCTGPRIKVKWNQYWPENKYCPNKITGCSPVAIAQVFSYFKPELDMKLTFEDRPYDNLYVNWDEIIKHTKSTSYKSPVTITQTNHYNTCNASEEAHDHLAALIREIGEQIHSEYKENRTSSSSDNYVPYINTILSSHQPTYVTTSTLYSKLEKTGVALLGGIDVNAGGHTWVADGVASINYNITTYYNFVPKTGKYERKEERTETKRYIRFNWGWAGSSDGYFLEGVYDTEKATPGFMFIKSRYNFDYGVYGYYYK